VHWQRVAVFVQRARIRDLRRAHPRLRALEEGPRQAVDAATEVGRLDGHQDFHLRRDLQHHSVSQKRCARASTSAAS
jgi:hypothetical protein